MKKTYSTPLVTASEVVQETRIGIILTTTENRCLHLQKCH